MDIINSALAVGDYVIRAKDKRYLTNVDIDEVVKLDDKYAWVHWLPTDRTRCILKSALLKRDKP